MNNRWNRRQVLQQLAAVSGAALIPTGKVLATSASSGSETSPVPQDYEIHIAPVSAHTFRLSVLPIVNGEPTAVPSNGSLVHIPLAGPVAHLRGELHTQTAKCGNFTISILPDPLTFSIANTQGEVQKLTVDPATSVVSFLTGDSPLLGLGEGGPQFDRRGSTDAMISGQGGYHLGTHGGRVPIPWLISTSGWALYFHQPYGTFDFTGPVSKFQPAHENKTAAPKLTAPFAVDIFVVASKEPATIMAEYARLTGHPEMPPLWSFGYQQSHRTLGTPEEVLEEAKMFREKRLPCDTMIYLGTGFCPNGWNTENGSFVWNSRVFPEPKEALDALHQENFRAVVHVVILSDRLNGTVHDGCDIARFDEAKASCHWDNHRRDFAQGVDGWWPDEGDPLDIASRLTRNRMYWEGPQIDRPNERPFSLHRNGYAGMQRYGSFLWSGDVSSTWETLKTHLPVAINTALTGIPYWGTDIGGFVPTKEFTAELYLRWLQFGAFCPLFRCHGRTWKLRLPWGWNTGDPGPVEIRNYNDGATPDASQLHDERVEPICRKYLELRYRMLPYLYSAVHECAATGMPILRALWLHYSDDPRAVACGDQYLWGRNVLVAPVVEKGATSRQVYLPNGDWFDFWTGEKTSGGQEVSRAVDLETMPLYVRAGSLVPMGPVKQYVNEKVDGPTVISIYPGADAEFLLYEDDGTSFNYRKGEWMGVRMHWQDASRKLTLRLAEGSRMLQPTPRTFEVQLNKEKRSVHFDGNPLSLSF